MTVNRLYVSLLGCAVFAVTACTGSSGEQECGANAGCAPGFQRDGVLYAIGCLGVAPDSLGPQLMAVRVNSTGEMAPLRSVNGWTPGQALAIGVPTTGCGNPGDGASEWSLAYPLLGPDGWPEQERITCDVALLGPGLRESCDGQGD